MRAHWLRGIAIVLLASTLLGCIRPAPAPAAGEEVAEVDCSSTETHPVAQSIADQFDVSYEQVIAWACAGEAFDDILLALQTSELSERSVDELLKMNREMGWDKVWEVLGLDAGQAE